MSAAMKHIPTQRPAANGGAFGAAVIAPLAD